MLRKQNVFVIIVSMTKMTTKSEKIGKFLTICSRFSEDRIVKMILYNYAPVAHFDINIPNERKLAAIDLVERGLCNQKLAGKLCGFHRNTVFKLLRAKRFLGIEAVLEDNRGLKEPFKYVNEVRLHIKKLLRKYPEWTDEAIAEQAATDLNMSISRSAVARIRTEGQEKGRKTPSKKELLDMAQLAESIAKEETEKRQLWLNFDTEPELKQKAEDCAKEPSPRAKEEALQSLIAELQRGARCTFAGGLMHHLFLQEIGFEELLAPFPLNPGATYQSSDILATIFHSVTQGIPSIETLKLVNAGEFGLLIGRSRIPDKVTIRDHLNQIADLYLSGGLIEQFARHLLEKERIDREVFFIDGHFLPYYGLNIIAKGYFTVRRLALKGNELYVITDLQGRPLFFITESNEIDFRPIISRSVEMLQGLGIKRPVLVFDRGGYGIHSFKELDRGADFVTWAKYLSEKSLNSIPDESFTVCVRAGDNHFLVSEERHVVSESAQTAKREGRETPISMELRLVILKDADTGKRIGIYTNNTAKPAYDIAYYMLQRWGKSENVYKELMASFNLNYHPGYDIKELEEQPLVDNPDIALFKKAIRALKREAEDIEKDILLLEAKLKERQDKRLVEKLSKFQEKLVEKKNDIFQLEQKSATLPDKISITEILKGKAMSRCDLEKKKLYDLMQFMAYHSRERLIELFRKYYDDHRDVKKVLDMITKKSGIVKLVGQTLMVMLDWIDNKKHRQAAQQLCHRLNQIGVRMIGGLDVKLSFHIARTP